ncbi:ATP-dependent nuclease [Nitrincola sp. MINF-07-Sa-05]|uniref:ATP-dependent nuclease n=1 Tax=Nitrincola salilacus TaxID=3400273 RepID=UPI003917EE27
MRLKSIYIGQYKNLQDFSLNFDGDSFIDVFVGKNGTGKSNLFEALIEIFRHLDEFDRDKPSCDFNYRIGFEIDGNQTEIDWNTGALTINGKERKTVGNTPLPDNVLIYYSGHNDTVANLVEQYEESFRKRIKRADFDEARYFIGIGPDYKELLLAVLLIQPDTSKAKQFICKKLGIETVASEMKVVLERPAYASGSRFDIESNDETDRYWQPEGITKTFLDRFHGCINTATGSQVRSEGYFPVDDCYILYYDITKIRQEFSDLSPQELFRQLDNLKTLGMLAEITIPLQLTSSVDATIAYFSDGQFQSVYIYSIIELFKDRNCITLLDEPDSFLHPEWQFDFLKQVFEITDTTAKNNHVLMTSHSASTITNADENVINLFEFNGSHVVSKKIRKADVIKSLSAGLISFSESEARLNIHHVLKNTTGAVLFTEGITDEMILETAWSKLYPTEERSFEIQNAFSCGFLRNLIKDNSLYQNHPGRTFFSVFDFDEAYNDWNQLGQDVQTDPCQCLVKKHNAHKSYAMLLPVPANGLIHNQVINPNTGGNYGNRSLLTIELLFHGVPSLDQYFVVDTERTDSFIKFVSDGQKVAFAKDVVPTIDSACFEVFRPLFEFIIGKCGNGQ